MIKIKNKKVTVGIWMHTHSDKALVGEGISRVLAFVVRATQKRDDVRIVIGCLSWMEKPIYDFLKDLGIDTNSIEFVVSSKKIPLIYRYRKKIEQKKHNNKSYFKLVKAKIKNSLKKPKEYIVKKISGINSVIVLALFIILVMPFGFLLGLLFFVYKVIKVILKLVLKNPISNKFYDKLIKYTLSNPNISKFARYLYHKMVGSEYEKLLKSANRSKYVDCWFLPYPVNEYADKFVKPLIVAVADVVYLDFPQKYVDHFPIGIMDDTVKKALLNARATISYSNYVRDNHVLRYLNSNEIEAFVIPHANISTYEHLEKLHRKTNMDLRALSERIIRNYIRKTFKNSNDDLSRYLREFSFDNVEYLFVSSQVRPHKNYLNLFKAYEMLLRKKYRNMKLIITGNPIFLPELQSYIEENQLQFDIIPMCQLPPKIHAAFYARAALTVVPTLFEGGFPGPFTESLSVGVPVVMSSIPVTTEMISGSLADKMLFDPYDIIDMVKRIEWALDNKEDLLEAEMVRYKELGIRTWDDVGNDYIDVFKSVVNNPN